MSLATLTIDARMYFSSGIGTALQNLIPRFANMGFDITLLVKEDEISKIEPHILRIPMKSAIYSMGEQMELFNKVPESDLFWSPHYNIPLLPMRVKKRFVTIHDVCHLALTNCFSPLQRFYAKRMLRQAIKRSDAVFVDSQFTKREIKERLQREDEKIKMIHLGVDKGQFSNETSSLDCEAKGVHSLPDSYFLFVGNLKPHKNLTVLLEAFEMAADRLKSDLVVVGPKENFISFDDKAEEKAARSPYRNRIRFLGKVEQKYLPSIYRAAKALVFPSLYEGFGFPALEAMQSGIAVLASKIGALEEICGEAALYFDPKDSRSLAHILIEMEKNKELEDALLVRGKEQLLKFDWDQTALSYANEMKRLLL